MLSGLATSYVLTPTDVIPLAVWYSAVITGTPDFSFAIQSLQAGLYNGTPSYCAVTTEFSFAALTAFNDRIDGELVVYQTPEFSDGPATPTELMRFNLDDVRYSRGPRSRTITLQASRQTTVVGLQTFALAAADVLQVTAASDGSFAFGVSPTSVWARAGDSFTWEGATYLIKRIDYSLGPSQKTISLSAIPTA
jgi:hypothetical protein